MLLRPTLLYWLFQKTLSGIIFVYLLVRRVIIIIFPDTNRYVCAFRYMNINVWFFAVSIYTHNYLHLYGKLTIRVRLSDSSVSLVIILSYSRFWRLTNFCPYSLYSDAIFVWRALIVTTISQAQQLLTCLNSNQFGATTTVCTCNILYINNFR